MRDEVKKKAEGTRQKAAQSTSLALCLLLSAYCLLFVHPSSLIPHPFADAKLVKQTHLVTPARFNLDEEFEMAAFAQQLFDVVPGARADLFELCAAMTDDDFLLALTLDEDGAIDAHEVCALLVKLFG